MAVTRKQKKYKLTGTSKLLLWLLGILLVAGIGAAVWFGALHKVYDDAVYPREYSAYVREYAKEYKLDENLVYAVIKTESGFDPDSVSVNDAKGLMQVTEETFDWLSGQMEYTGYTHDDLHDPQLGIEYGCYLLGYLQERFGDTTVMLAAYHAGMNITAKWLEDPSYSDDGKTLKEVPYSDTEHYIKKVLNNYKAYQDIYGE